MATVLNNTKRNFRAHEYINLHGAVRVRTVKVAPGFNTLSAEDLELFLKPKDVKRAIDAGALIVNAGVSDVKPVEHQVVTPPKSPDEKEAEKEKPIEVKTKKQSRKKKKKSDESFKDFD